MADVRTADDSLRKFEKKLEDQIAKSASLQADVDTYEAELEVCPAQSGSCPRLA